MCGFLGTGEEVGPAASSVCGFRSDLLQGETELRRDPR